MNDQTKKAYWVVIGICALISIFGHTRGEAQVAYWVMIFEAIAALTTISYLNRFELKPQTRGLAIFYAALSLFVLLPFVLISLSHVCAGWGQWIASHMSPEQAFMECIRVVTNILVGAKNFGIAFYKFATTGDKMAFASAKDQIHWWTLGVIGIFLALKYATRKVPA